MPASSASPNWLAEGRSGEEARRSVLPYFVLLSLLVHVLTGLLKFDFWPKFPVDRGSPGLSVVLPPAARISPLTPDRRPHGLPSIATDGRSEHRPTAARSRAIPTPDSLEATPSATAIDATDLIERGKAELNAASRRQMLDPMFSPASRPTSAKTPIERATSRGETTIEELGPSLFRVTNADGSHYCLQRLPEIATRDIPGPLVGVPMTCR